MILFENKYYMNDEEIFRMKPVSNKLWYELPNYYYPDPYKNSYQLNMKQFFNNYECDTVWIYKKKTNSWDREYKFPNFLEKIIGKNKISSSVAGDVYISEWDNVYVYKTGCGQCDDYVAKFDSIEEYLRDVCGNYYESNHKKSDYI